MYVLLIHKHDTVVNSDFFAATLCFFVFFLRLCVHAGSLCVESSTAMDTQTGGCQQHTNKLSRENQSGVWNDLGWGNKHQQVIKQNWLKMEGWNEVLCLVWLFICRSGETLSPQSSEGRSYTCFGNQDTKFWRPAHVSSKRTCQHVVRGMKCDKTHVVLGFLSSLCLNSYFYIISVLVFVVSMQSPSSRCMRTRGRTRPYTAGSSGHATGARTANTLWHPVGTRR